MPSTVDIVASSETPPPLGASPRVHGSEERHGDVDIAEPDPALPAAYERVAVVIREALGPSGCRRPVTG